jgi:hypothetical protein
MKGTHPVKKCIGWGLLASPFIGVFALGATLLGPSFVIPLASALGVIAVIVLGLALIRD